MTFLAILIDLKTGECRMANAAQTFPYLRRGGAFKPLTGGSGPGPLGSVEEYSLEESVFRLQPGDSIICYTDGVYEPRTQDQAKLKKTAFLELISKNLEGASDTEFFGGRKSMNPDDITLVMTRISSNAP